MAQLNRRGARPRGGGGGGGMMWMVAAVVLALLVGALIVFLLGRRTERATDIATGCLQNGPAPEAALFMVDATDRLSPENAQRIAELIKSDAERLPRFSQVTVVPFGDDTAAPFQAMRLDCWPGTGKDAGFDQNARVIEEARKKWEGQISGLVDQLTSLTPSKHSPITAQIVRAASEPTLNWHGNKRLLVLFSDGLESSIYWTRTLKLPPPPPGLLKDVDAEFVEVGNAKNGSLQSEDTRKQWNAWLQGAGANARMTAPGYATGTGQASED